MNTINFVCTLLLARNETYYIRECDECQRRKQGCEHAVPLGEVSHHSPLILLKLLQWIYVDHTLSPRGKTSTS